MENAETSTHTPPPGASQIPPEPAIDGSGAATNGGATALAQKIERASASAVDLHLSDPATASRRGKRGKDKRPRKLPPQCQPRGVPVEGLGNGSGDPHLAEGSPSPLFAHIPEPPPFDEATARTLVEIGIGLLNDGAAAIVGAVAKKETGDRALADEAGKAVRMSEKVEGAIREGAVLCAKKYAVRLDYAPEMMLGGGLVIWLGQVSMSIRALKSKGSELRERQKKPQAPPDQSIESVRNLSENAVNRAAA
jgi:hypothetical protein